MNFKRLSELQLLLLTILLSVRRIKTNGETEEKAAEEDCVVGDWGPWSECDAKQHYHLNRKIKATPYRAKPRTNAIIFKMMKMMKFKKNLWNMNETCRLYEPCPLKGYMKCAYGMAGNMPCTNVHQLAFLDFQDLGFVQRISEDTNSSLPTKANDIWGWTDPESGDEYAIIGLTEGTSFVRITDPIHPVTVGFIYTETNYSTWRDMKVIGNYVYIVSEATDHGLQIFDLTRLRNISDVTYFEPDVVYQEFGNAHNVIANEESNFIYVVGSWQSENTSYVFCEGGLHVIDVNDPLNPKFVACYDGVGYIHDAQCVIYHGPDVRYKGKEICFTFNGNSLAVLDVTDKDWILLISRYTYTDIEYCHQGWLTDDHSVLVVDDELDEMYHSYEPDSPHSPKKLTKTFVWDASNLARMVIKSVFISSERAVDHNQYVKGNLVFQSNYEAGLRILNLDQKSFQLYEIAYFDVYPKATETLFKGSWSVYPYFSSGNVVISSIDFGLFVVRPNYFEMEKTILRLKKAGMKTRTREIINKTEEAYCPFLEESASCYNFLDNN